MLAKSRKKAAHVGDKTMTKQSAAAALEGWSGEGDKVFEMDSGDLQSKIEKSHRKGSLSGLMQRVGSFNARRSKRKTSFADVNPCSPPPVDALEGVGEMVQSPVSSSGDADKDGAEGNIESIHTELLRKYLFARRALANMDGVVRKERSDKSRLASVYKSLIRCMHEREEVVKAQLQMYKEAEEPAPGSIELEIAHHNAAKAEEEARLLRVENENLRADLLAMTKDRDSYHFKWHTLQHGEAPDTVNPANDLAYDVLETRDMVESAKARAASAIESLREADSKATAYLEQERQRRETAGTALDDEDAAAPARPTTATAVPPVNTRVAELTARVETLTKEGRRKTERIVKLQGTVRELQRKVKAWEEKEERQPSPKTADEPHRLATLPELPVGPSSAEPDPSPRTERASTAGIATAVDDRAPPGGPPAREGGLPRRSHSARGRGGLSGLGLGKPNSARGVIFTEAMHYKAEATKNGPLSERKWGAGSSGRLNTDVVQAMSSLKPPPSPAASGARPVLPPVSSQTLAKGELVQSGVHRQHRPGISMEEMLRELAARAEQNKDKENEVVTEAFLSKIDYGTYSVSPTKRLRADFSDPPAGNAAGDSGGLRPHLRALSPTVKKPAAEPKRAAILQASAVGLTSGLHPGARGISFAERFGKKKGAAGTKPETVAHC